MVFVFQHFSYLSDVSHLHTLLQCISQATSMLALRDGLSRAAQSSGSQFAICLCICIWMLNCVLCQVRRQNSPHCGSEFIITYALGARNKVLKHTPQNDESQQVAIYRLYRNKYRQRHVYRFLFGRGSGRRGRQMDVWNAAAQVLPSHWK